MSHRSVAEVMRRWSWLSLAGVACLAVLLVAAGKVGKPGKKTHLGVPPSAILSLQTGFMSANNLPSQFFYDTAAGGNVFVVPDGFSFIVTDVFVTPQDLTPTDSYNITLDLAAPSSRFFAMQFTGGDTHHFPFASGMVIPAGITPDARNGSPSKGCLVKLLGYLIKGEALNGNESAVAP